MTHDALLRIGELSRRTGVSPEVLRAWERRYHLFSPQRSDGGFRLYPASDVSRIRAMKLLLAQGASASQAAQQVLRGPVAVVEAPGFGPSPFDQRASAFSLALFSYDEAEAQRSIDQLLMEFDAETIMRSLFLPALREIGQLWERGLLSIAQEHFASNLIRQRLGGLARGWEDGIGPRAILACPPDEEHDIPLMMLGIALGNRGWRVTYLGARTPAADLVGAVENITPAIVVIAAADAGRLADMRTALHKITEVARVAIAGAGASQSLAEACGAEWLVGDPVSAADEIMAP